MPCIWCSLPNRAASVFQNSVSLSQYVSAVDFLHQQYIFLISRSKNTFFVLISFPPLVLFSKQQVSHVWLRLVANYVALLNNLQTNVVPKDIATTRCKLVGNIGMSEATLNKRSHFTSGLFTGGIQYKRTRLSLSFSAERVQMSVDGRGGSGDFSPVNWSGVVLLSDG